MVTSFGAKVGVYGSETVAKIGASDHRSVTTTSMGKMEETATGAAGGASKKASGEKRLIAYGRIGPGFTERCSDLLDRDLRDPDRAVFIAPEDRHGTCAGNGKAAARNQKTDAE